MKLLYISEDYINSQVHHQLLQNIVTLQPDCQASIFSIKRDNNCKDIHGNYHPVDYFVSIRSLQSPENKRNSSPFLYKYLFPYKIRRKYELLRESVDVAAQDYIFAATLFSEGALAYQVFQDFKIPYSVAVRGSDVNFYLKYMPHLWQLGRKIIANAQKVVFLSETIKGQLLKSSAFGKMGEELLAKSVTISNGIDDFWLENRELSSKSLSYNLLYVGRMDRNKNVETLVEACALVRKWFPELQLNIVGEGGDREEAVKRLAAQNSWIKMFGGVYDKEKLKTIFRNNDLFAMISFSETFGLVYVEALSQGLPIIYTQNQGIDGFFKENIGVAVNPHSVEDTAASITRLLEDYTSVQNAVSALDLSRFRWKNVAQQYLPIFKTES